MKLSELITGEFFDHYIKSGELGNSSVNPEQLAFSQQRQATF